MRVLGIESSCDETGVAVFDSIEGLVVDVLYSQADMHADYGGVVPELASRDHLRRIVPLINEAMRKASLSLDDIGGVAYTQGPGLVGALLVGAGVGRALAFARGIPCIGVHHMEGHLLAPMLDNTDLEMPFLALLVSGGHTQLVTVDAIGEYMVLGESLDDAVGEAFDKAAKMVGLGYPGGPEIERAAENGDVNRFVFPRPMTDRPGLDFSFSGLKTFCLNTVEGVSTEGSLKPQDVQDIACAFQRAVVETLAIKCKRAIEQTKLKRLVVAGGVSANTPLRSRLDNLGASMDVEVYYPRHNFCTDNGAMIAYAGCQRLLAGQVLTDAFSVRARWPLTAVEGL